MKRQTDKLDENKKEKHTEKHEDKREEKREKKTKKILSILEKTSDPTQNIIIDTLMLNKQALVFVNTKPSAESTAEKIANSIKPQDFKNYNLEIEKLKELKEKILSAVSPPTKQCKRESICIEKGIAFHHSGLHPVQKELIEESFRSGLLKVICATPTLAYGLDLPAFRAVIRDLKRYGKRGLQPIPVLDYEQQAGRAGRPGKEDYGEAIAIAQSENEKEEIIEKYLHGDAEDIYSKLAVEPVLRTYVLSLVASSFIKNRRNLEDFFGKTFYAHQFGDRKQLFSTLRKMILQLQEWEFLKDKKDDFVSADSIEDEELQATLLGKRVSELYLDPYTAHVLMEQMRHEHAQTPTTAALLFMISRCLEMRPLPRVKASEYELVEGFLNENTDLLFEDEPSLYEEEYEEFLEAAKQAVLFREWIEEKNEEYMLETYNTRPGELRNKLSNADWLVYSVAELSKLLSFHAINREALKLRTRLEYGAREELLPLLRLKGIGKVRARMLFQNKIRDLGEVKSTDFSMLSRLLGKQIAADIKKQVGEEVNPELLKIKEHKRKGQMNLGDYRE